jgi:hypothetical protein
MSIQLNVKELEKLYKIIKKKQKDNPNKNLTIYIENKSGSGIGIGVEAKIENDTYDITDYGCW